MEWMAFGLWVCGGGVVLLGFWMLYALCRIAAAADAHIEDGSAKED